MLPQSSHHRSTTEAHVFHTFDVLGIDSPHGNHLLVDDAVSSSLGELMGAESFPFDFSRLAVVDRTEEHIAAPRFPFLHFLQRVARA